MTCTHCCDTNKIFEKKKAEKELNLYIRKGPKGATKKFLKALSRITKRDKTLLDIGGGIGIIQWEFLKEQARSTTDIDAAGGYLDVARTVAREFKYLEKTNFIQEDFNDVAADLDKYDFVTLDKVVCCYPDYEKILLNATAKSNGYVALSYPISNLFSKLLNGVGRLYFLIKKSEFKTYIHPSKKVEQLIVNQGFRLHYKGISFPWNVQVFERV